MSDTDQPTDGQSSIDRLEQRVYALEEEIISVKEENEDLKSALEQQQDGGLANVSRRQMLGLLGSGALLGGMGTASADSNGEAPFANEDHDHSGDYLGEANPVSAVRFEELYNAVGDAAPQTAWNGLVVPVAPDLGPSAAVDPSTTPTPVQDAIDALPVNGGTVLLPPETVVNEGSIHMRSGVSIQGWGRGFPPDLDRILSGIHIPNEDADLIRFDADQPGIRECRLDGFHLQGPLVTWEDLRERSPDDNTGVGIRIGDETKSRSENANVGRLRIGRIGIMGIQNALMRSEPGAKFTECRIENINATRFDAGNAAAVFDFSDELGVGAHFGVVGVYPVPDATGMDSNVLQIGRGGELSIRHLNIGGAVNRAVSIRTAGGEFRIDELNFEARAQLEPSDAVVFLSGTGNVWIGSMELRQGQMERVYRLDNENWVDTNGHNVLGPFNWAVWRDKPWTAEKPILIDGDTTHSTIYMGPSDYLENNTGKPLSTPVSCLGDLTLFDGDEQAE